MTSWWPFTVVSRRRHRGRRKLPARLHRSTAGDRNLRWVEFMHSFEMLTKISGDPLWADRCEEIAVNSFPASQTPDLKALHYLTGANMVQLDARTVRPVCRMKARCCPTVRSSVTAAASTTSRTVAYYAEELWLATADRGLCTSLYAASEVTAKVGDGTTVKIAEDTEYPFDETINLKVSLPQAAQFPLYLRIPRWCKGAEVKLNGQPLKVAAEPLSYVVVDQKWSDGDTVTLRLPMALSVRTWPKNRNAVSVDYGPLTFALKIGERWQEYGTNPQWPEWEVFLPRRGITD